MNQIKNTVGIRNEERWVCVLDKSYRKVSSFTVKQIPTGKELAVQAEKDRPDRRKEKLYEKKKIGRVEPAG